MPDKQLRSIFLSLMMWLGSVFALMATHNRAGEITYRHVSGNTYEITITTCTKTSVIADREWLQIKWGDDLNPNAPLDSIRRDSIFFSPTEDWQINYYSDFHTYPGPGVYILSVEDPNRNEGVNNIPESVVVPFYIESMLTISPLGHNNSVKLLNPAKGDACLNAFWIHNPAAYDPDGDSLAYKLIPCAGEFGNTIVGYEYPDDHTANTSDVFSIDVNTGDVTWDTPQLPAGEYNIAFKVEEYRNGILVGYVVRDMQITVLICNNQPPDIQALRDTCIEVGQNLQFTVEASDPDGNNFTLQAIGGPMSEVENPAFFNPSTGLFSWTPGCEEIRALPYQMVFKAEDFGNQIPLLAIETMLITVVAPAVENPTAEPDANTILLNWDQNPCIDAVARPELGSYKIYRRSGLYGFDPSQCELGVPAYTGYEYIGAVQGLTNTSYLDDDNLNLGGEYCYMVVTCFPDGSVSYASVEFCAMIDKDTPVMTNVSVDITGVNDGQNYVAWSPPGMLDTLNFPGPYWYELYFNNGSTPIFTTDQSDFLFQADTIFTHIGIDTESQENEYRVIFYANGIPIGSNPSTSLFVEITPNDNQLTLSWDEQVSWVNTEYEVFRFDEALGEYVSIGVTSEQEYTDEGLVNNETYCYYVRSRGTFGVPDIIDPVINFSQEICAFPVDLTAPCPPELEVEADCENELAYLTWTNPNESCADDVVKYRLYYTSVIGGEYSLIEEFFSDTETSFTFNLDGENGSIAGCYAITAVDSLLPGIGGIPNENESEWSEVICIDNCPIYFLPNVFSPNGDGVNDFFVPFPYKFVKSVDCKIFNRWGGLVFSTEDPDINWDGTSNDNGEVVSDGVYFYRIIVYTIRLEGLVPVELSGNVTVLGGNSANKIKQ